MRTDSGRHRRMEETRHLLLATARALFAEHGYFGVTTPGIAAAAGLTRGALYHHFPAGLPQLFEAVHAELQVSAQQRVAATCDARASGPIRTLREIETYLEIASEPDYGRIVLQDGPSVLGWARWRESELAVWEPTMAAARANTALRASPLNVDVGTLELLVFGALGEAALAIASSADRIETRARVLAALKLLLRLTN